ncbi:unnamed protein product [Didymodactylos carnosus]|uniref:Uncharacterized protein n=1 Tax=Didymodactylos carnosus TaxID=1234261 RepID=A0A8S2E451_9BILA|nr:unnamed protein product [Didymodactylos carnosus]CAF3908552.1 unnamed protein product [Didymodactylos carnosus]
MFMIGAQFSIEWCVKRQKINSIRIDELQTHPFMKNAKKISNDPRYFMDETRKIIDSQSKQQQLQNNDNGQLIGDIFGTMDNSNKEHIHNWEF